MSSVKKYFGLSDSGNIITGITTRDVTPQEAMEKKYKFFIDRLTKNSVLSDTKTVNSADKIIVSHILRKVNQNLDQISDDHPDKLHNWINNDHAGRYVLGALYKTPIIFLSEIMLPKNGSGKLLHLGTLDDTFSIDNIATILANRILDEIHSKLLTEVTSEVTSSLGLPLVISLDDARLKFEDKNMVLIADYKDPNLDFFKEVPYLCKFNNAISTDKIDLDSYLVNYMAHFDTVLVQRKNDESSRIMTMTSSRGPTGSSLFNLKIYNPFVVIKSKKSLELYTEVSIDKNPNIDIVNIKY